MDHGLALLFQAFEETLRSIYALGNHFRYFPRSSPARDANDRRQELLNAIESNLQTHLLMQKYLNLAKGGAYSPSSLF